MTHWSGLPAGITGSGPNSDRVRLLARQLITIALDFFFPPRCLQCKRVGSLLCPVCLNRIPVPSPVHDMGSPLSERRATAVFEGVIRDAIHALKYEGQRRYAEPLGQRLAGELTRSGWQPTLLTSVPLHESRQRARGYNQCDLLASQVARTTGIPFRPDAIRRIRDTHAQVGLGAQDRQLNVAGAFQAVPDAVSGQRIAIIDDVCTTGATLRECASALLEAGATKVWALTVASAKYRDDSSDDSFT
jgi:ComF family protein